MGFTIDVGKEAPSFQLPGIDGKVYDLEDFGRKPVLVVMFTCNHCPFVVGSEERMVRFYEDYAPKGVAMIGVNSNDAELHPEDSFDKMEERARERGFRWPYLRDESQETAIAYGAIKTPHFFALDADRVVRYTGRMDDSPRDASKATTHELRDAIDALLAGGEVPTPVTEPIGCTVKWKGKDPHFIPNDACDLQ